MRLLKIGRDPACDIVLRSPKASALHAELTVLNNGDILLEDKNSTNGTFVMNRPIKPGTQVSVKRGDAIRFADVELVWTQVPMAEDLSRFKAVYGIGTSMRNEIQVSGNTVSRYHATLKIDHKGNAYIQDHSRNGTTINGERLGNGQTRQIKRSDSVVCGGVPVNLAQFLPRKGAAAIVFSSIAAAIVLSVGIWAALTYIDFGSKQVNPATERALENASVCVFGGYKFEVTLKDNPFKDVKDWPEKWVFGSDGNGNLVNENFGYLISNGQPSRYSGEILPFSFTGTAFFISESGELGTNRHIAVPWEYHKDKYEDDIRNFLVNFISKNKELLAILGCKNPSEYEYSALLGRASSCLSTLEISGSMSFFGIGLTGSKVEKVSDLLPAQVIAESGDPKKDVALIRLNNPNTPSHLVEMGAIYDLSQARVDETQLKPQQEDLTIIGYPAGLAIGYSTFDGKELRPTLHKASISKMPDENEFQIQTVAIGGQSGSPVIDKNHRLVGILYAGIDGMEVTYCCNIKHLVELYNKNRIRQ